MAQQIWVGDGYEVATDDNSEIPEWPIQDAGGRWRYEEFDGQRVRFDRGHVDFGFLEESSPEPQPATL